MMFSSTVDFRLSLDFFDSGLYTCAAVARLTLALAKLSCRYRSVETPSGSAAVTVQQSSWSPLIILASSPLIKPACNNNNCSSL